ELDATRNIRSPLIELMHGWYIAPTPAMTLMFSGWAPFQSVAAKVQESEKQIAEKSKLVAKLENEGSALEEQDRKLAYSGEDEKKRQEHWGTLSERRNQASRARWQLNSLYDSFVFDLVHRIDLLLQVLDKFVIPVMLGMLGALIFILRSLITQIQSSTYV